MSLCKVICKTIQYVPIMGVLTPVIWGCLWAPNMGMKSAYEAEENVTCLAPGDTCLKISMLLLVFFFGFFFFGFVCCFLFFSHASPQFGKNCC